MSTIDTGAAKLPALPPVNAQDPSLRNWMSAVAERLEVREGSRGNPNERVVTQREIAEIKKVVSSLSNVKRASDKDLAITLGNGITAYVPIAELEAAIFRTRLWTDLQYSLDDPRRFDYLTSELRALVENSIADEAAKRGADIKTTQLKIQDANRSIAALTTEITAALNANAAGLRQLQATYASSTSATAVQVTQLESSLGNYYQDGSPGRAQLEQTLLTQAEYITGLRAQYSLKLSAGGAVAGFGLSATEVNGVPDSAFIIQADKFAVVSPTYSGGLTTSPTTDNVPFGVDSNGVYINGTVRINANGQTLSTLATNAAAPPLTFVGNFAAAPSTGGRKKNEVYRNTADGNSYVLSADNGTWQLFLEKGATGATGNRGSVTAYASGSAWSDTIANNTVLAFTGSSAKIVGDTVTISNGSNFAQTRYWGGSSWLTPGVVIDGNLLVNGTVTADKVNGRDLKVFSGGHSDAYVWPPAGTSGFHLSGQGLLLGNFNNGKYFQVSSAGDIYAPQFSIVNGVASFQGEVFANKITGDVNKVVAINGDAGGAVAGTGAWITVGTATLPASSHPDGHAPSAIITVFMVLASGDTGAGVARLLIDGAVVANSHSYLNDIATVTVAGSVAKKTGGTTFTVQVIATVGAVSVGEIRGYLMGVR